MLRFVTPSKPPVTAIPPLKLAGPRVLVRPPRADDWQEWTAVRGRDRDYLRPYEPEWPDNALSRSFFMRRLARQVRDWREDRAYSFMIMTEDDVALIGGFNINNVCRGAAQYASIGYWLASDRQGHGFMREAAQLVIDYSFNDLRLHRLNAATLPDNGRSRRLLTGLGFREEGFAPRYVQINGDWRDHVLFGLCREDWNGIAVP